MKRWNFNRILLGSGITCLLVAIASTTTLLILNSPHSSVKADENYTGRATVASVNILQAGTGAKATLGSVTLDENIGTTDDVARRQVLNNNIVRYRVIYDVSSAGRIAIKFIMPANSVVDSSSIAGSLPVRVWTQWIRRTLAPR